MKFRNIRWILYIILSILVFTYQDFLADLMFKSLPNNFFQQRDSIASAISYSYISLGITTLSVSTLSITIGVGRLQYLLNETTSKNLAHKLRANKNIWLKYTKLIFISFLLLFSYLTLDFSTYLLFYIYLIVVIFYEVSYSLYNLYQGILKDFSVATEFDEMFKTLEMHKNNIYDLNEAKGKDELKYTEIKSTILKSTYGMILIYRINKTQLRILTEYDELYKRTKLLLQDISFAISNSYRRNDTELVKILLDHVTSILIMHLQHFDFFLQVINPIDHSKIEGDLSKIITSDFLPKFKKQIGNGYTIEILNLLNDKYGELLIKVDNLVSNTESSSSMKFFDIILSDFANYFEEEVKSHGFVIKSYTNTMGSLLQGKSIENNYDLISTVSYHNVKLAEIILSIGFVKYYASLLELQSMVIEAAFTDYDDFSVTLFMDTFSIFNTSLKKSDLIEESWDLYAINSTLFQSKRKSSLLSLIQRKFKNLIESSPKNDYLIKRFLLNIEQLTLVIVDNSKKVASAYKINKSFMSSFVNLVGESARIIADLSNDTSKNFYLNMSYNCFKDIALSIDFKEYYDISNIFFEYEELLSITLLIEDLRYEAIEFFIEFVLTVYSKTEKDKFDSRYFKTLFWIPIICNYDINTIRVIEVIKENLSSEDIEKLIQHVHQELNLLSKGFRRSRFDSLKDIYSDKILQLEKELRE